MKRFDRTTTVGYHPRAVLLALTLLMFAGCGGQSSESTLIEAVEVKDPISKSERDSPEYMQEMKGKLEAMLEEEGEDDPEGEESK